MAYVRAVAEVAADGRYDVLLPVHEQVFAFAAWPELLPDTVAVALPPFEAVQQVLGKAAFARLLRRLALPQPETEIIGRFQPADLPFEYPYYVKRSIGTAGRAVWEVPDHQAREAVIAQLSGSTAGEEIVVQAAAPGVYRQALSLFDQGRLVAFHCSEARAVGMGGSAAARVGVAHPAVQEEVATLGKELAWHGALALDYIYDHRTMKHRYIEANPRLVEPMNATVSGLNMADLLIRLSLGSLRQGPVATSRSGCRSHGLMAMVLGEADRTSSRRAVVRVLTNAALSTGPFTNSRETLAPIRRDPVSAVPALFVAAQVLARPRAAGAIATAAVDAYALTPEAVKQIEQARGGTSAPDEPPNETRRWGGKLMGLTLAVLVLAVLALVGLPNLPSITPGTTDKALQGWIWPLVAALSFFETAFPPVSWLLPFEWGPALAGAVAGHGEIPIIPLLVLVWACSAAGDSLAFLFGRRYGRELLLRHGRALRMPEARLAKVETWFDRYGPIAVVLARLTPYLRAFTPFVAGSSGFPYRRFLAWNALATALFSAVFCLGGYFFYRSSDALISTLGKAGIVLLGVVGLTAAGAWWRRRSQSRRALRGLAPSPRLTGSHRRSSVTDYACGAPFAGKGEPSTERRATQSQVDEVDPRRARGQRPLPHS